MKCPGGTILESNVKFLMLLDPDQSVNDQGVVWLPARSYFSKLTCYSVVDQLNQSA